ncbi:hypothetical protein N0B31_11315 [Salinirubellus salinus]|uniref:Uncharacterized protein n=1 Tax=Salinirubellus salinus TaxID=1364945 RepID=A0A9E7U311_9EURY|nr:hypothetical protein [Salinirubellus salinus]UWM52740.1 hypothetical protein N0B31_11315 [Salinirubellus salinus]
MSEDGRRRVLAKSWVANLLGLTELSESEVTDRSKAIRAFRRVSKAPSRASEGSITARLLRRFQTFVQASFGYRWLTAEPDPDVVVIDLRKTWTVGPIIAILDRFISWFRPRWQASLLGRTAESLIAALRPAAAESAVVAGMRAVLVPPAPPERERPLSPDVTERDRNQPSPDDPES